jgi:hypothetical protein
LKKTGTGENLTECNLNSCAWYHFLIEIEIEIEIEILKFIEYIFTKTQGFNFGSVPAKKLQ